ncbi:MAG TPA: ATP-dependent DNA helicase, partial [Clostridiales bacterium]|nr:ATP-dependent DNA helicase [Clostridiales bacterium]
MEDFLNKLNSEQILPVLETQGPVLVIAGAGSGKTRVLTGRIAYLVEKGLAYPEQILAITFTNKASNEMRERLSKMVDNADAMWICTIHSMCVRILRREADKIGYNKDFSIYSESDKELVLKKLIKEKNITEDGFIKTLKTHISIAKNKGVSADRYYIENKYVQNIGVICECFSEYEEILLKNNAMDFDDLLINTQKLFAQNPETCLKYSERFKYIHVDEFQDTNKIQYEIIRDLATVHQNIFVVGDDDQSIYAFRGATIVNILNFENDFPNTKIIRLEENYRCPRDIVEVALSVIKNNSQRHRKNVFSNKESQYRIENWICYSDLEEAKEVAEEIERLFDLGFEAKDIVILFRTNSQSRVYENELLIHSIDYKILGGVGFYERI